jgi:plastocyanin
MQPKASSRPDLTGEVRFKVPLVLAIPLTAVAVIAVFAVLFSRVLLSVPPGAATTIAIISAANILGACAFLALRPDVGRASVTELLLVALYRLLIGVGIGQTGIASDDEAATTQAAPAQSTTASSGDSLVAEGLNFNSDTIDLDAKKPTDFSIENKDSDAHNLAIYESEGSDQALFTSPDVPGGATEDFTIDPLDKGEYYFQCDFHPAMNGAVEVQ